MLVWPILQSSRSGASCKGYDTVSTGREMALIWLTIDNGSPKWPFWRSFRRDMYRLSLLCWDRLSSCLLGACFEPFFGIANRRRRNSKMHYAGYLWIMKWRPFVLYYCRVNQTDLYRFGGVAWLCLSWTRKQPASQVLISQSQWFYKHLKISSYPTSSTL